MQSNWRHSIEKAIAMNAAAGSGAMEPRYGPVDYNAISTQWHTNKFGLPPAMPQPGDGLPFPSRPPPHEKNGKM